MSDISSTKSKKALAVALAPAAAAPKAEILGADGMKIETPKVGVQSFEMPKMEVPAALREFAEKNVEQARTGWEKFKSVTEEATGALEGSYASASKGCAEYGMKLIETGRTNTNAAFDFAGRLMTVKSVSEAIELSTSHIRTQFETLSAQTKELSALAQKVATDASAPVKDTVTGAFRKVA